jgi:hypothetical protein
MLWRGTVRLSTCSRIGQQKVTPSQLLSYCTAARSAGWAAGAGGQTLNQTVFADRVGPDNALLCAGNALACSQQQIGWQYRSAAVGSSQQQPQLFAGCSIALAMALLRTQVVNTNGRLFSSAPNCGHRMSAAARQRCLISAEPTAQPLTQGSAHADKQQGENLH